MHPFIVFFPLWSSESDFSSAISFILNNLNEFWTLQLDQILADVGQQSGDSFNPDVSEAAQLDRLL